VDYEVDNLDVDSGHHLICIQQDSDRTLDPRTV